MPRQQARSSDPGTGPVFLPPTYSSPSPLMSPFPYYPQQQWQAPLLTTPGSSQPASVTDTNEIEEMQNHIAQLQDQPVAERRHQDAAAVHTPDTTNNSSPAPQDFYQTQSHALTT